MVPVFTEQGVEIDYCPACKGVWLDKGEIYYFTKKPKDIFKELNEAIKQGKPSERLCPRTGKNMQEIELLKGKITLDYSPASGGIWFDRKELTKLRAHFGDKFKIRVDRGTIPSEEKIPPAPASLPALPNLFIRSTSVLIFLYGLLTLILITLNEEEVKGVVAHEIGHAKHWDMLIMTATQLAPLILYYFYRTLIRMKSDGEGKSAGPRMAIASYVLYIVSQYVVLWLSRTREYFADRFAGETTQNPNCLASGLVKIGYGLAGKESEKKKEKEEKRKPGLEAVRALGIFDPKSGVSMAVSSLTSVSAAKKMGDEIDKENLKGAMKWDLWNPWAKYDHQEAEVIGWYRRAPVPYIELKSIKAKGEKERRCYTYIAKYVMGGILAIISYPTDRVGEAPRAHLKGSLACPTSVCWNGTRNHKF